MSFGLRFPPPASLLSQPELVPLISPSHTHTIDPSPVWRASRPAGCCEGGLNDAHTTWGYSWEDATPAFYVLMYKITGDADWRERCETYLDAWIAASDASSEGFACVVLSSARRGGWAARRVGVSSRETGWHHALQRLATRISSLSNLDSRLPCRPARDLRVVTPPPQPRAPPPAAPQVP